MTLKQKIEELWLESFTKEESDFHFEKAVKGLLKAYKDISENSEVDYQYKGCELDESYLLAAIMPIASQLNKEGLEYNSERDRDLLNVIIMCAIQLGINEGIKVGRLKAEQKILGNLVNYKE